MKKSNLMIGLIAWVFAATLFLSRWWYANPNFFPNFPDAFWDWLDRIFDAGNVDQASNVEFITVVFTALVVVLLVSALIGLIYGYFKKNKR